MRKELSEVLRKESRTYASFECENAFCDGVVSYIKNLWHDGKEEPKPEKELYIEYKSGFHVLAVLDEGEWAEGDMQHHVVRWLYTEDLSMKGV